MSTVKSYINSFRPLTEREKMLQGLPYNAMNDMDLVRGRLRARKYLKEYNVGSINTVKYRCFIYGLIFQDFTPPDHTKIKHATDYFGPDERLQILADLFQIPLVKTKRLAIEPPFYCDYGTNIEFKDEFYSNFNMTVSYYFII